MARTTTSPQHRSWRTWSAGLWPITRSRYAPGAQLAPHCDGHFRLSVIVSGQVREQCGSTESFGSTLSVVTKPADARHSNQFGPKGADIISVEVPNAHFDAPGRSVSRLSCWRWDHGGALAQAIDFISIAGRGGLPDDDDTIAEHVDLLLDALALSPPPPDRKPPRWLHRTRQRVHDSFRERTPVQVLAADAGVHPAHLTRWFRHFYGHPVTTYRQQLRVKAAADALITGDDALASVAADAGFYDQNHMNRAFRIYAGIQPGRLRRTMRHR